MKQYRLPRNITLNGLIIFVVLFCVSSFAFLEHTSISISAFSSVKLPLLYVAGIGLVTQIKTISRCIFRKKVFYPLLAVAVFCVLLVASMFANWNTNIGDSPLRYTFRLLLYLVEVFLLMIVIAETGRGKAAISFLFWYLLLITIVNDALMFTQIIRFVVGHYESYLVGTKFSVSYLHMNVLTLWVMNRYNKGGLKAMSRVLMIVLAIFIVSVAIRVDCMTGVLGCLLLVCLFVMMEKGRQYKLLKFSSPWFLLIVLMCSVVFAFVAEAVTEIPIIKYVVEDLLNRDTSITGRTNIYEMYVENLEGRWMIGYGYGNGNEAAMTLFGYENVQNGVLQWVLQVGIPATIGMIVMMMQVFRLANRAPAEKWARMKPLIALIYMYIALGTIETTFNMSFILWFATIFMLANEKTKSLPTQEKGLQR